MGWYADLLTDESGENSWILHSEIRLESGGNELPPTKIWKLTDC